MQNSLIKRQFQLFSYIYRYDINFSKILERFYYQIYDFGNQVMHTALFSASKNFHFDFGFLQLEINDGTCIYA